MSRYLNEDDLCDLFADERKRLTAEYEGEIAELRAEVADLREQVKTLAPLWDALRLSRSAPLVQASAFGLDSVRVALYVDKHCGEPVLAALKAIAFKIDSLLPVEVSE
jgi:hypothetical protein